MERTSPIVRPSDRVLSVFLKRDFEQAIAQGDEELLGILKKTVTPLPPLERERMIAGVIRTLSVKGELPTDEIYLSRIHLLGITPVLDITEGKLRPLRDAAVEVLRPAPLTVRQQLVHIYVPLLTDPRLDPVHNQVASKQPTEDLSPELSRKDIVDKFWEEALRMFERQDGTFNKTELAKRLKLRLGNMQVNIVKGYLPKELAFLRLTGSLDDKNAQILKELYYLAKSMKRDDDKDE